MPDARIEQYALDADKLIIICPHHGASDGRPVLVGSPECIALLNQDDVVAVECNTGFGSYTLRKRQREKGFYWYARRRADRDLQELYVGPAESIDPALLDEIAIKLYR